jgi:superfamily II DNA or RNA helicase
MNREEVYGACLQSIQKSNCLLLELATGTGKSKHAIDIINYLCATKYQDKQTSLLLLVAKTVHKQTWREEFEKWGGIKVNTVVTECYESLRKHAGEHFTFILFDEVHHVKSEARMDILKTLKYDYMLGLSATIPRKLQQYFKWKHKAEIISCDIQEAIEDEVLPEPQILLWPLELENTKKSEELIVNPKVKHPVVEADYKDRWKYKKNKNVKAIIHCTQQQKMAELNSQIEWMKNLYMRTRSKANEQSWLYLCGKRLEFLADCKLQIIKAILNKLKRHRTITFCKTIKQTESLGRNCIHSKNRKATETYEQFNQKKINHITAVNILNENANLVECKYAIFANISSSDILMVQRIGRALRHKKPVIIIPYFKNTREQEIIGKMFADYDRKYIKIIHSITEI